MGEEAEAQKVSLGRFTQVVSWQSQDLNPDSRPGLSLREGTTWPSYQTSQPTAARIVRDDRLRVVTSYVFQRQSSIRVSAYPLLPCTDFLVLCVSRLSFFDLVSSPVFIGFFRRSIICSLSFLQPITTLLLVWSCPSPLPSSLFPFYKYVLRACRVPGVVQRPVVSHGGKP